MLPWRSGDHIVTPGSVERTCVSRIPGRASDRDNLGSKMQRCHPACRPTTPSTGPPPADPCSPTPPFGLASTSPPSQAYLPRILPQIGFCSSTSWRKTPLWSRKGGHGTLMGETLLHRTRFSQPVFQGQRCTRKISLDRGVASGRTVECHTP